MTWDKLLEANRLRDKVGELNKCINLTVAEFNHHVFNLKNFECGVDEETVELVRKVFNERSKQLTKEFEEL